MSEKLLIKIIKGLLATGRERADDLALKETENWEHYSELAEKIVKESGK